MAPRLTPETRADRAMSEKTLQSRVVGRAKRQGWRVAHAGRGIAGYLPDGSPNFITPMARGWPDLMLFRVGHVPPVIAIELKRELGNLQPEQLDWLALMIECGIPAIVIRPSDLREGRVTAVLK